MNKILRKIRKIFYLNQIRPGPRFGRLPSVLHSLPCFVHWRWTTRVPRSSATVSLKASIRIVRASMSASTVTISRTSH